MPDHSYAIADAAWQAYTPAWTSNGTQPVLNNGTLTARYTIIGNTLFCQWRLIAGSTSTFGTGAYFISLPVPVKFPWPFGGGDVFDSSGNSSTICLIRFNSSTTVAGLLPTANNFVGAVTPFTWAQSDEWKGWAMGEIA